MYRMGRRLQPAPHVRFCGASALRFREAIGKPLLIRE